MDPGNIKGRRGSGCVDVWQVFNRGGFVGSRGPGVASNRPIVRECIVREKERFSSCKTRLGDATRRTQWTHGLVDGGLM